MEKRKHEGTLSRGKVPHHRDARPRAGAHALWGLAPDAGTWTRKRSAVTCGACRDEVDRRRAAEAVRARELAAAGRLARLWRPVGELRSLGIWRAADEDELHEKVLGSLPLRPWMSLNVTALESHPNDPGRTATES